MEMMPVPGVDISDCQVSKAEREDRSFIQDSVPDKMLELGADGIHSHGAGMGSSDLPLRACRR
jgi:hypothetical protein